MIEAIRKNGNPFLEFGNELVNLQGDVSEDKESVLILLDKGKQQYDSFVNEVLIRRSKPFDTPIQRNHFLLFKTPKRKRVQGKQVRILTGNVSLLGQMYIATQSRKGNVDEFFAHEFQEYPPSIASNVDKMYRSKKSDILVCLRNEVQANEATDVISAEPLNSHAIIWDGGASIHFLTPTVGSITFEDYFYMCFFRQN